MKLCVDGGKRVVSEYRREDQEWRAKIRQACEQWPRDAHYTQEYLAARGWYMPAVNLPMGSFGRIREMIELGRDDEVESLLQQIARSRIPTVLEGVQRHWPDRWEIIRDALEAHESRKFTLSIPALLPQADGIANELFKVLLFSIDRNTPGEPRTKQGLDRRLGQQKLRGKVVPVFEVSQVLLEPLRKSSALMVKFDKTLREHDSKSQSGPLNRHGVMHGLDAKYASEANSLRAILLIAYLIETHELLLGHEEHVQECAQIINDLGTKSVDGPSSSVSNLEP